jgi:hypothetical protein
LDFRDPFSTEVNAVDQASVEPAALGGEDDALPADSSKTADR